MSLYTIKIKPNTNKNVALLTEENKWHEKLGHASKGVMLKLLKMADGVNITENKIEKLEEKETRDKATRVLQILHSDVCGPKEHTTYDRQRYVLSIIDDYSNFTKIYLMKTKSETPHYLKDYINEAERELDGKVSILRCDNGGEYTVKEFITWCQRRGIKIDYTTHFT